MSVRVRPSTATVATTVLKEVEVSEGSDDSDGKSRSPLPAEKDRSSGGARLRLADVRAQMARAAAEDEDEPKTTADDVLAALTKAAKDPTVITLQFAAESLRLFPPPAAPLVHVTSLDLSSNRLRTLPPLGVSFPGLTRLALSNNPLGSAATTGEASASTLALPAVDSPPLGGLLAGLGGLASLALAACGLDDSDVAAIPPLPHLRECNLADNHLAHFPLTVARAISSNRKPPPGGGGEAVLDVSGNFSISLLPPASDPSWGGPSDTPVAWALSNNPTVLADWRARAGDGDASARVGGVVVRWKLAFPSEVVPGLLIGGVRAVDPVVLAHMRITHVLSVGRIGELLVSVPPGVAHRYLVATDAPDAPIAATFSEGVAFIDSALGGGGAGGERCVVHCFRGSSRSATLVLAWLLARRGMTLQAALELCVKAHPLTAPNAGFLAQLRSLERALTAARAAGGGDPNKVDVAAALSAAAGTA